MKYKGINEAWEEYTETVQTSAYMQKLSLKEDEKLFMQGYMRGFEAAHNFCVRRLEIIDHSPNGEGRAYIKRGYLDVDMELQDEDTTLKIFIK